MLQHAQLPSVEAHFMEAGNPSPLVQAVLRSVARWIRWPSFTEPAHRQKYFDGTQYDERPYNWDGSIALSKDTIGVPMYPGTYIAPMNQRKPNINYLIGRTIVERLTSLLFGEETFPEIKCEEDQETDDFVQGIKDAALLHDVCMQMRDSGGTQGRVAVSYGWGPDGAPVIEVHPICWVHVLQWADTAKTTPSHVLKVWPEDEYAITEEGLLDSACVWLAREWRAPRFEKGETIELGAERFYRYVKPPKNSREKGKWVLLNEIEAEECSVVIVRNGHGHGKGDFEKSEDGIDELNLVLNSTTNGTTNNAEPTLCIPAPEGDRNDGTPVRKGGFNVIWAAAEYLEISGSHVAAGLANADRLRAYLHEDGRVAMFDPEKISGVQSGEALRKLMFPTTQHCGKLRIAYGNKGIALVIEGLVRQAQRLVEKQPPPKVDVNMQGEELPPNPEPLPPGVYFRLPPKVEKAFVETPNGREEKVVSSKERLPGTGKKITLIWPPYFPDSAVDEEARLRTVQNASGGKAVMSHKTAIERAKPITKVVDADAELEEILEAEAEAFERQQATMLAKTNAKANAKAGSKPGGAKMGKKSDDAPESGPVSQPEAE